LPGVQRLRDSFLEGRAQTEQGRLTQLTSYKRVEQMDQSADDRVLSLNASLRDIEDIDLPKTILELQLQQIAYQAALGATQRIITTSLADFLR